MSALFLWVMFSAVPVMIIASLFASHREHVKAMRSIDAMIEESNKRARASKDGAK